MKTIFKKVRDSGTDVNLALLGFWSTPTYYWNGWITITALMGRHLHSSLLMMTLHLTTPYSQSYRKKLKSWQLVQQTDYSKNSSTEDK